MSSKLFLEVFMQHCINSVFFFSSYQRFQVNTQLYNTKERQQLVTLIDNMISYNLTYHQERLPDGQFVFNLDP